MSSALASDVVLSAPREFFLTSFTNLPHLTDLRSQLSGTGKGFYAHLIVGEKQVKQLVYMDTGSSLSWINCYPCVWTVPEPIYNPKESSTYEPVSCISQFCGQAGAVRLVCEKKKCTFLVRYADNTETIGHLAKEVFKFGMSQEIVRNIIIGCAKNTNLRANGILGLGPGRLSLLVQRKAQYFSYCIGNISDTSYPYNTLIIGDQIEDLGNKTPLTIENKYFITLEGIVVGNKSLEIDPKILRIKADYTGGMMVDTGATNTYIQKVAYLKLEAEIRDRFRGVLVEDFTTRYREHQRLCYNGVIHRDLRIFPEVIFVFKDGATMELTVENLFHQLAPERFCLAVLPSEDTIGVSIGILGNLM